MLLLLIIQTNEYHLNNGGLHLNHHDDGALAHNLIQHIQKLEF